MEEFPVKLTVISKSVYFGTIVLGGAMLAAPAYACSICRCGDATFNALGSGHMAQSGWRLALDVDETKKSQGSIDDEFSSVVERRTTAMVAFGTSDRFSIIVRQPLTQRDLRETAGGSTDVSHARGVGDTEIQTQTRLWASTFAGDVGLRTMLYGVIGVKTAWGENDAQHDGSRLDEHVQPGTGAVDWIAGLSGVHQLNPHSSLIASVQQRMTGVNKYGYRYGGATLVNFAVEYKLKDSVDAALEANYRNSMRDEIDHTKDSNTGGSLVYVTPHLLWHAGAGMVVRVAAQVPTSQRGLNGVQHEHTVWNIGLTWVQKQ
jgi:hypothetical protein